MEENTQSRQANWLRTVQTHAPALLVLSTVMLLLRGPKGSLEALRLQVETLLHSFLGTGDGLGAVVVHTLPLAGSAAVASLLIARRVLVFDSFASVVGIALIVAAGGALGGLASDFMPAPNLKAIAPRQKGIEQIKGRADPPTTQFQLIAASNSRTSVKLTGTRDSRGAVSLQDVDEIGDTQARREERDNLSFPLVPQPLCKVDSPQAKETQVQGGRAKDLAYPIVEVASLPMKANELEIGVGRRAQAAAAPGGVWESLRRIDWLAEPKLDKVPQGAIPPLQLLPEVGSVFGVLCKAINQMLGYLVSYQPRLFIAAILAGAWLGWTIHQRMPGSQKAAL